MLSIVVPTISGREESLARTLASYYEHTTVKHEVIVIKDEPTWPQACNEGYRRSKGKYVLFGADDLDCRPYWWQRALKTIRDENVLPAPRVYDYEFAEESFSNDIDGKDGDFVHFTRVPFMSREQWETIGAWPGIIYYADIWVSEKARTLGIRTKMVYGFDFVHHWCPIGRVDSKENMDASGWALNRLREEMV